jgi:plasmid stability protein
MSIMLQLPPEIEQALREKAARLGQSLEAYLEQVAEREAQGEEREPPHSADQWVAELRAWAASHRPLETVVDDSRESIYEGRGE